MNDIEKLLTLKLIALSKKNMTREKRFRTHEWRIPANEHCMAKVSLNKGTLTLSYVEQQLKVPEKRIRQFREISSLEVRVGGDPSVRNLVYQEENGGLPFFQGLMRLILTVSCSQGRPVS